MSQEKQMEQESEQRQHQQHKNHQQLEQQVQQQAEQPGCKLPVPECPLSRAPVGGDVPTTADSDCNGLSASQTLTPTSANSTWRRASAAAGAAASVAMDKLVQGVRPAPAMVTRAVSAAALSVQGLVADVHLAARNPGITQADDCLEVATDSIGQSATKQITLTMQRSESIGGKLAERVLSAQGELTEAFQLLDDADTPTSRACRGVRQRAFPLLRQLKFAPLNAAEMLGAANSQGSGKVATAIQEIAGLARSCWEFWQQKHAALTASEQIYATLLSDSRRTNALAAELKEVEALILEEGREGGNFGDSAPSSSTSYPCTRASRREQALSSCCTAMEEQRNEAISAFKERAKNYPCGWASPVTRLFRIARSTTEVQEVLNSFAERVAEETKEAMTQAMEIVVVPGLGALADSLDRRLQFWENEIEENWSTWTRQSTIFHDACNNTAESWSELQVRVQSVVASLAEGHVAPPQDTPPVVYLMPLLDMEAMQQERVWDDLHDVLVEVASTVALLGAWTDYHNLRGDGQVVQEARELFAAVLEALDVSFQENFPGSAAVRQALCLRPEWNLVAPCLETIEAMPEESRPWWSPQQWPKHAPAGVIAGSEPPIFNRTESFGDLEHDVSIPQSVM